MSSIQLELTGSLEGGKKVSRSEYVFSEKEWAISSVG
jgi:hypothetical protein